jgi:putative Ca2+/H+ antiporter (TMEM165/GDT1 family)
MGNHLVAAWAGSAIAGILRGFWFQLAVAVSFLVMAAWIMVPDEADTLETKSGRGPFITTLISFFLVEIGDKTQVATVALGARYESVLWVTLGTTLGMMLANVPAVWFGERVTRVVPVRYIRWVSALIFFGLGAVALFALSRR